MGIFFLIEKFDIHPFFDIWETIFFLSIKKIFSFLKITNFSLRFCMTELSILMSWSIISISFILKIFNLDKFILLNVVRIIKKKYKLNIFYLLIDASFNIQSSNLIKSISLYFAISGTKESLVIPGWVLISSK